MTSVLYSPTWITSSKGTIVVEAIDENKKRIKTEIRYETTRGVIKRALEAPVAGGTLKKERDLRAEVEVLSKFRDDLGRRMPPVTSACAIVAHMYNAHTALVKEGSYPAVERVLTGEGYVYFEKCDESRKAVYKHTETRLDRLFLEVFGNDECTEAEFRNLIDDEGRLFDKWASTNQIGTFWEAIKTSLGVSVRVYMFPPLQSKIVDLRKLANGIRRSMIGHFNNGMQQEYNYVALFPIHIAGCHHTLARAEYEKSTRRLVVTYYDSDDYDGGDLKCGMIRTAFELALVPAPGKDEVKFERTFGQNAGIEYTMEIGTMQKQEDQRNCGVFVCIAMLEAAGGAKPRIYERTIDEGDINKVRCIIARRHKKAGFELGTKVSPVSILDDDDEDGDEVLSRSPSPKKRSNRALKVPTQRKAEVVEID